MILPDCGHALLGTEGKLGSPALWQVLLPRFAEIQIESYQDAQRWLALGVPDRRLALLPAQFAQLLSDESAIALDQTEGLQRKEREQARQMLPYLEACCQALSASAYSVGLCQGDFHTGNILSQGSSVVFADWGDASVTHPFCSLLLFYHTVGLTDDTVLQRADELAKPYLRPWCARTGESIEALIQTLHAALWIAHVIRALCWDRHQPQLEQRQGGAPQTLVVKWIRLWLRRKDLLMRNPMITEAPSSAPLLRPSKLATGDNRLLLSIEEIARLTGGQSGEARRRCSSCRRWRCGHQWIAVFGH